MANKLEHHAVHPTADLPRMIEDLNIQLGAISERLRAIQTELTNTRTLAYNTAVTVNAHLEE